MREFLVLGILCLAGACAAQNDAPVVAANDVEGEGIEAEGASFWEKREDAIRNFDNEACRAKGGEMRQEGMLGMPRCNISYGDAGKICSDEADCEGRCLNDDSGTDYHARPGQANGQCEADDSPFGCYAEIHKGNLHPTLCVD